MDNAHSCRRAGNEIDPAIMKRLTDDEIRAMLTAEQCSYLGRFADIQARLDEPLVLTVVELPRVIPVEPVVIPKVARSPRRAFKRPPLDEAWFQRQVEYVRKIAADQEHQGRYLNGIAIAHGDEMRARVGAAA